MGKTVIIAAGGTGGHLYPGIVLARALRDSGFKIIFVIKENDLGKDILIKEKFEYKEIPGIGMPRKASVKILKFVYLLFKGFFKANSIIKSVKPAAVFGMGNYLSFPVILSAKLNKIKTIIHEQNVLPGLTNRILSRLADITAISFEDSRKYFGGLKNIVLTGNPFRADLFTVKHSDAITRLGLSEGKFTILVFGGSQGAARINSAVSQCLSGLDGYKGKIQAIHVTGQKDFESIKELYEKNKTSAAVFIYLPDIGDAYEAADFIISRAGAMTVTELKILNKPSLLIPFPFATDNHQLYNAKSLEKSGNCKVILEKDLNIDSICSEIKKNLEAFKGHKTNPIIPAILPQSVLAGLIIK